MRNLLVVLGVVITINSALTHIPSIAHTQEENPAYAKWGRLAVKEVQSNYPDATVIDYLHEGRETKGDKTIEKFKLWLKDSDKEFGVFVRIEYTTETEEILNVEFRETFR
jgi:Protein of unknown function (DUF3889)